ncbi:hypothetical protein PILCRDRAFT_598781 [Piloderma croceum F 1598]|uniref:DUF6534 domain-containing protein n=1 Tax=Piloderma croceum (strain F 1598) TaxID=765440 RepID=A0A0C3AW07_PILCF|nr:hypothetical protein PILCRDRAFT_598781 [Piloderma croceum F 1598]
MAKSPAEIALGPMFIGTVFNVILYGIMITQVYLYFSTYKKDRTWLKCVVLYLFLADTVNAVFDLVYVYLALVVNFDNPKYIVQANWIFGTEPAMTVCLYLTFSNSAHHTSLFQGIIASCVQLFFAWRVKVVTSNIWAVMLIVFCAFVNMLASIGTSIAVGIIPVFTEFVRFKVIVIIWLVAGVVADVCITTSLTYHLRKQRTGFSATDDLVNRIIRLTVQTGAVTAVVATVDLIVFLVDTTGIHLIFNVPLPKLYTNSLMSSLNARGGWKFSQHSDEPNPTTITTSRSRPVLQFKKPGTIPEVFVHVESHEMADIESNKPNRLYPDAESE